MSRNRLFALIAVAIIVSAAGCSGVLPGGEDSSGTPIDNQTTEPTATASSTPETATSTPSPTATPTPTPVPDIVREHRDFGRAIGEELRKHSDIDGDWIRATTGDERTTVIVVRKPSKWTIKRTEMEVVREAVRLTRWRSNPSIDSSNTSVQDWHRPDEIKIIVQDRDKEIVSRLTLDTELAVNYAESGIGLKEFTSRLDENREADRDAKLGENATSYYLRKAEWRQIRDEQIRLLNARDWYVELDYSKIRVGEDEIYYHYSPPNASQKILQERFFLRTYWEAIRNVSQQRLSHRFPKRMRLYADVPSDEDLETTIRTKYAFDFIKATDGDITDENILANGAYNLYYPKRNTTRYPDR
jgi:hypothetical protein